MVWFAQVDRVLDLIFNNYVPRFEAEKLVNMFAFLNTLVVSSADVWLHQTAKKLEGDVKRYYIVHALQKDRADRVVDFFEHYGDGLLRSGDADWPAWFCKLLSSCSFWNRNGDIFDAWFWRWSVWVKSGCLSCCFSLWFEIGAGLPYMKDSSTSASFQVYFSTEWLETLQVSVHSFLCEVFEGLNILFIVLLLNFGTVSWFTCLWWRILWSSGAAVFAVWSNLYWATRRVNSFDFLGARDCMWVGPSRVNLQWTSLTRQ